MPPEAQREPSGDTVTVFRYPVCPMWFVFSLQLARFHTWGGRSGMSGGKSWDPREKSPQGAPHSP